MQHFQVLSALLTYPEPALIGALDELQSAVATDTTLATELAPLFDFLKAHSLIELQENYVATFDRNPKHSLHLFEHVHGESRDRGQAMVDLLEEYRKHGLDVTADELPDFIPLFLEFLSQIEAQEAQRLLGDAIHVMAKIGQKLSDNGSAYQHVFHALKPLTDVSPLPLEDMPEQEMEEMLETFGPGADGVEPLLKPQPGAVQTVQFYPRQPARA